MIESESPFQSWIDKGYEAFSRSGPNGIKVQSLARKLGVSKSSFYHHFGDQESFIELLLEEHDHIAEQFGKEVIQCKVFDPDFVNLIMKYKSPIFFQQQLRFHRENPDFEKAYQRVTDIISRAVLNPWSKYMELSDRDLARNLYLLIIDVFYERVREKNFDAKWIHGMFDEVKSLCNRMVEAKSSGKSVSGTVR